MKSYLPLKVVLHRVGEPTLQEYGASRIPLDGPQAISDFLTLRGNMPRKREIRVALLPPAVF